MVNVDCVGLSKVFDEQGERSHAVRNVSLSIHGGEMIAIVGSSGSGKTTLLRMLGCMLQPTRGAITFDRSPLPTPQAGAAFRNAHIGFIFQDYALIEDESAQFNVEVPLHYRRDSRLRRRARRARASQLLADLGITDALGRRTVSRLSGGERQRVAIARALANDAELILADEPTGSLDEENTTSITSALRELADRGRAVLIVTHDGEVAAAADRVHRMSYGRLD